MRFKRVVLPHAVAGPGFVDIRGGGLCQRGWVIFLACVGPISIKIWLKRDREQCEGKRLTI